MRPRDEDEAWRQIVDNYGERPTFEEPSAPEEDLRSSPPGTPPEQDPAPERAPEPAAYAPDPWEDEGRFVPPVPPPVPRAEPRRRAAWLGVFVAPAILLVSVVLAIGLPRLITLALVTWFIGGFLYLVVTMPNGPRDPGDDGARL